jgi:hypothetical protein
MWQGRREEIPALDILECQWQKTLKIWLVTTSTTLAHVSTSFA